MDAIETTAGDLSAGESTRGVELSSEAHWNQTPEDWRHFLARGHVLCERDGGGRAIATGGLMTYGDVAWIGLVLVTPAWRRRGLATRLMRRCMDLAAEQGALAGLDATPDGAKVYEGLGFRAIDRLTRFRRAVDESAGSAPGEELLTPDADAVDRLCALDAGAFGADRSALLADIAARPGARLYRADDAAALVRLGRTARHVGPLHAGSEEAATRLLARILEEERGPLLIDFFDRHSTIAAWLAKQGFSGERPFLRMTLGGALLPGSPDTAFAAAGPEYG
ncbi:GNAT family N-acetyltransferase [Aurantimonas aggregata]|uniref:GNAT family N-acetyltransferase n=1 Tax=Aurantimonas aggregata TaxID=2047720 RepID=A0A6L9MFD3_9HYPH|nr:GNAT family N-acetyltransferase [Aurantimonas aggregata]NDV86559.1 GNAT family N-acetyltransferase [Aurantimonas aggregata]